MFVKRKQSWAQNHRHTSWWCCFSQLIGSIETDKNHKIVYNEHFLPARFETFFWLYSVKSQVTTFTYTYHTVNGNNPAPVDMAKVPLFTRFYTGGCLGFLPSTVLVDMIWYRFVSKATRRVVLGRPGSWKYEISYCNSTWWRMVMQDG